MARCARSATRAWVNPCRSRSSRTISPSFFACGLIDCSHQVRRLDVSGGEQAAQLLEGRDLDLNEPRAGEAAARRGPALAGPPRRAGGAEPLADALEGQGLLAA